MRSKTRTEGSEHDDQEIPSPQTRCIKGEGRPYPLLVREKRPEIELSQVGPEKREKRKDPRTGRSAKDGRRFTILCPKQLKS